MAGTYNIVCEQGATFRLMLTWRNPNGTPVNVTGYSAKMDVRQKASTGHTELSLSTAAGGITLGGVDGTVLLTATATTTNALVSGVYVYDLELTSAGGEVTRLVAGSFTVDEQVTR